MDIPTLPSTAVPVEGKDDRGKKVIINSVGGALKNVTGTIVVGPYTFTYKRNKEDKGIKKRGETITSVPYWQVHVDVYDSYQNFIEKEITFKGK